MTTFSSLVLLSLCSSTPFLPEDFSDKQELPVVRIRASGPHGGYAYATGAHIGNGLVLTCGHCVESAVAAGAVDVGVVSSAAGRVVRQVRGRIVSFDPESDLGLVLLEPEHGLTAALQLAGRDYQVVPGDDVYAFEWSREMNGDRLSYRERQVTAVNRYLGSANLETTGRPEGGSSGGPLLTKHGLRIVGITQGALVSENRGLYVGLEAIYRALDHFHHNRNVTHSEAFLSGQSYAFRPMPKAKPFQFTERRASGIGLND
ncbi:MAG: trypsin-like peptidase domain-containing protein [Planctomycetaceae bacterium]|nr:trypsin-like peptidase domain-containing protein [Planctomycetaceae bacterium]